MTTIPPATDEDRERDLEFFYDAYAYAKLIPVETVKSLIRRCHEAERRAATAEHVCGYDRATLNTILEEHAAESRKQYQRAEQAEQRLAKLIHLVCEYLDAPGQVAGELRREVESTIDVLGGKEAIPHTWPAECAKLEQENAALRDKLAATPEAAAQQWQPIATAPKDETWILLATPSGVQCGYWGPTYFGRDHVWVQYSHRSECEQVDGEPTHWMPLPEPPEAAQ